ncbi:MAG: carbamoyltransferase HypF [Bacillota bacterium]|nr:carbamoyltransferase HypF [Bacillota bacterium]
MAEKKDLNYFVTARIEGVVQGVGFRPFTARLASFYNIKGFVKNESDNVYIEAAGSKEDLLLFLNNIRNSPPAGSKIIIFDISPIEQDEVCFEDFKIIKSTEGKFNLAMPSPDISICGDCLRELFAKDDPRYLNPFISCTNCGPRFTIINKLPYDRGNTTMGEFPLCGLCDFQYKDTADRRCHAQTVCCNKCGPVLTFFDRALTVEGYDALERAVKTIMNGGIIAVKGIGGYHLACSPYEDKTVNNLRLLKGREEKPFAIMFPSIEEIEKLCFINKAESALLLSREKPIVLLERKDTDFSERVYGSSRFLGAFLPYTPLHHLILSKTGPLIMTSANSTTLPIIKDDDEIKKFFIDNNLLDGVISHDRCILRRVDDSVAAVIDGHTQLIRRARGYVPLPIKTSLNNRISILACGSQQKNTTSLSFGSLIYPSTEIGDLDSRETISVYKDTIDDMQKLLGISPTLAVCDLHPLYESTKYALTAGLPVIKVQHHFAHIASVMAENNITSSIIGVAFDGTGYGTDGTIWGGEFLIASPASFTRVGHLKSVKFIGSDDSIKQGWKSALCLLSDAGLAPQSDNAREKLVRAALNSDINTIMSSSMGRVFDAVSSILGICHESGYEGQCAIELENAAAKCMNISSEPTPYPFNINSENEMFIADLSPCLRSIMKAKEEGEEAGFIALRFHSTVCQLILDMCKILREKYDINTVALSGGVFQNRIILSGSFSLLQKDGFKVYTNAIVPPGDGGISLGQAYIGLATASAKEK